MRVWRRLAFLGLAGFLVAPGAWAGLYEKGGADGLGARGMGLAGAYCALADDETAVWWNPAGLGNLTAPSVGSSLGTLYDGRQQVWSLGAALPLPAGAAAGMNWHHARYPQAVEMNTDSLAVAGSLPLTRDRRLYLGGSLKLLWGAIRSVGGDFLGLGMDLGLKYRLVLDSIQWLELGFCLQDLDTRITWPSGLSEQIPQSVALGGVWHMNHQTLAALEVEQVHSGQEEAEQTLLVRVGAEHWFRDIFGMRAGFLIGNYQSGAFTLGAGLRVSGYEVEYALQSAVADLGISHRLSVSFGVPSAWLKPSVAAPVARPTPAPTPALQAPEYPLQLLAEPPVFSPNGDGVVDQTLLKADLREADPDSVGSWRLSVENASAEVVYYKEDNGYPSDVVWDGRDREGQVCPDGMYVMKLLLADAAQRRMAYAETPVLIITQPPEVSVVVDPVNAEAVGGRMQNAMRFSFVGLEGLEVLSYQVVVQDPAGVVKKRWNGEGALPKRIVWEERGARRVEPGVYAVILTLKTKGGLGARAVQSFSLRELQPKLSVQVKPEMIRPGEKQAGQAVFTLSAEPKTWIAGWTLMIQEVASGKIVRRVTGKGAPPAQWTWNGRDQQGRLAGGGQYFHSQLIIRFQDGAEYKSNLAALSTDLDTEITGRALTLHLTAVLFEPGSSALPEAAIKNLVQACETVHRYAKDYRVQVKGYTDSQEAPGQEMELSWERARKVREYVNVSGKIPLNRIDVVGYGAHLPLASETTAAGRTRNRRAELVLIIKK